MIFDETVERWAVWRCGPAETLRLGQELANAWCPVVLVRRRLPRARATREVVEALLPTFLFLPVGILPPENAKVVRMMVNGRKVVVKREELEPLAAKSGQLIELEIGTRVVVNGDLFEGREFVVIGRKGARYVLEDPIYVKKVVLPGFLLSQIET